MRRPGRAAAARRMRNYGHGGQRRRRGTSGRRFHCAALSCAAVAAGADALLIEVHPCPADAWCDADQALSIPEFADLMRRLGALANAMGRSLAPAREVVTSEPALAV